MIDKKIKKVIGVLLLVAITVLTCQNCVVMASENENGVIIYEKDDEMPGAKGNSVEDEYHYLDEMARGNNRPNEYWDLSKRAYVYVITGMRNYVYSEFYFSPSEDGRISISTDGLDAGGGTIKIILYKNGWFSGTEVSSWTGDPQSIQGLGFPGLDTSEHYYFKFETVSATSVTGEGKIHHPE